MKKKITSLICGVLWGSSAFGADTASTSPVNPGIGTQSEWEFTVAPYFWAAGLSGKTAQFGLPTVDIDADFNDIFKNLDFAAMLMGEARKGRYSVFGDLMYTQISGDNATPRGILADNVKLKTSTFAGTIGAGYSILENSSGRLDLSAGLRVWSVDTDITFNGGLIDGTKHSDSATWVDGLVGLRGNYNFTPDFYAMGWGLVGAGGADSDWDVGVGVGYRFNKSIAAAVGYRAVGVNYRSGGFIFDVIERGPMAGLVISF